MDLSPDALGVGNISVARLLMHRLDVSGSSRLRNIFFSEAEGLEVFLKELVKQYPASEGCILCAVGHSLILKEVSAEMDRVKAHTLLSSTDITPDLLQNWTVRIPENAPYLTDILRTCAIFNRAPQENKRLL